MSKIFETMKSAGGEIPDLIRILATEPAGAPPRSPAGSASGDGTPAVAKFLAEPEPSPAGGASLLEVRAASLRVPAPSPLLPFENGQWRPSEQYRILRTKIVQHPKQPRLIVISSPASGDGKSVTAINTAAALSLKSHAQVLLLDADLRKSAIHTQLGLPESPGLVDVLRRDCTLEEALLRTREFPKLCVMTSGTPASNPVELLDSPNWQVLSARLRGLFRYVIMDSPPVGAVADYDLLQAVCDGVILVVRPDHTNRELCQRALNAVPKTKFLGVLLNCVPEWSLARQASSDYYYYSDEKGGQGSIHGTGA